ncbi:MAG: acyl carrier protein [Kibdelosporangium sp.]
MTENIAAPSARTAAQEAVLDIARTVLVRPALGLDDDVFNQGATSLSFLKILAEIKKELAVVVRPAELEGVASARNIAAHVTATTQGA